MTFDELLVRIRQEHPQRDDEDMTHWLDRTNHEAQVEYRSQYHPATTPYDWRNDRVNELRQQYAMEPHEGAFAYFGRLRAMAQREEYERDNQTQQHESPHKYERPLRLARVKARYQ